MKVKVTGLKELDKFGEKLIKDFKTVAREVVAMVADHQEDSILQGTAPDGSAQKKLAESTVKTKERVKSKYPGKALYRTGVLADPVAWKIRKAKYGMVLSPPPSRQLALNVLHKQGFKTVFNTEVHKKIVEYMERRLQQLARSS